MIGIFGGTGFIGYNLLEHFISRGIAVRNFSRRSSSLQVADEVVMDFRDPATYLDHIGDLQTVVLLVSASVPATFANDLTSEVEYNVLPYARFLTHLSGTNVEHVIYLSSGGAVYGVSEENKIDEDHPTNPISPYGCAKLMIEAAVKMSSAHSGWRYTILRPTNPVGRYQSSSKGQGLVASAVRAAFSDTPLEIWGDGRALRDYFDVRDLCSAISSCVLSNCRNSATYNVGMGESITVQHVVDICENASKRHIQKIYLGEKKFLVKNVELDCSLIKRELYWRPRFTLEDAVNEYVKYLVEIIKHH